MNTLLGLHFLFSFMIRGIETSVNLALGKDTAQSSRFDAVTNVWTSDKAVDGSLSNGARLDNYNNTCSVTEVDPLFTVAWWYVDLAEKSRISNVRIVYRQTYTRRLAGYSLFVSENFYTPGFQAVLCYKHNSDSVPAADETQNCTATGRYVTVYNERIGNDYPKSYSREAVLELCEVMVFGCPFGKFGSGHCNSSCSIGCANSDCYPDNGACVLGCLQGWINGNCNACKDERYGEMCQYDCSPGCLNTTCNKEDGTCVQCKENWTGSTCHECSPGKYGEFCSKTCSQGCVETSCSKTDGRCNCKDKWAGNACDTCQSGFYGTLCDQVCSVGCDMNVCNRIGGTCNCKDGWAGNTCNTCKIGRYGETCHHNCSSGCLHIACNRLDGTCSSCKENWTGSRCHECSPGKYGEFCSKTCSQGCVGTSCSKTDGRCNCKDKWSGNACDTCQSGFYGTLCDQVCSVGCDMNICNRIGGTCNCKDGWAGNTCNTCEKGRYGETCQHNCSPGCLNIACNRADGTCSSCKENWTGSRCHVCADGFYGLLGCKAKCSIGCSDVCNKAIGNCKCTDGWTGDKCDVCADGFYGLLHCEGKCSTGCNDVCKKSNGTCKCKHGWTGEKCEDCKPGFYGNNCDHNCSKGCQNLECNKSNGSCKPCKKGWTGIKCEVCTEGTYGKLCDQNCSIGCNETCSKANGDCGCKYGWDGMKCTVCSDGFFGKTCEQKCSIGCKQGTCNKTDGTCECNERWTGNSCYVCNNEFYGEGCAFSCSVGCLNRTCDKINGSCDGRCDSNWTGQKCDYCRDGLFGTFCEHNCSVGCNQTRCNKIGGGCDCTKGWIGKRCEESQNQLINSQPDEPNSTPAIVGTLFAVIALMVIGIVLFIFFRRRQRKPNKSSIDRANPGKQLENQPFSSVCLTEAKEKVDKPDGDIYENTNISLKYIIHVDKIREEVHRKREQGTLEEEFDELPNGAMHPQSVAEKEENVIRNRYKTTLPYDHSRVILKHAKTDYINANVIKGINTQMKYIGAQGPKTTTIEDFWQMVWQEQTGMIVMLTNIVEGGKRKCEQYWPDHLQSMTIDNLEIKLKDEMTYSFYNKRTFYVINKEIKKQRLVTQMHFTTWPDHGVPDPRELMLFHRRFKSLTVNKRNMPIVHCSAGIGRTGTFIALDAMVESARENNEINIFEYVVAMRADRMNMIQTKEQYVVLHEALVEALEYDDTTITKDNFTKIWTESKGDKPINQSRIRKEFKSLHSQRPKYKPLKDCKAALLEKNKNKNRSLDILALDKCRVFITPRTSEGLNYINAITLPSYRRRNDVIVTQEPLENTKEDFWHMVKEQRPSVIVSLDTELEKGHEEGESILTVSNWHAGKLPTEKAELVEIIEKVKCANDVEDSGPVIVVCRDGATCCGLFCVIYNSIQQLQVDGDVDIYQTAKQLLGRRPEFCQTFERYEFCYDVVMEYLNTTDIYSN